MLNILNLNRRFAVPMLALATFVIAPTLLQAHQLKICKDSDPLHPVTGSFTFDVSTVIPNSTPTPLTSVDVIPGACSRLIDGIDGFPNYIVQEEFQPNTAVTKIWSIINYAYSPNPGGTGLVSSDTSSRIATVLLAGAAVTEVHFVNSFVNLPGNQGCTPGYYKQPQHFSSWTYTTNTTVSSVFGPIVASLSTETFLQALQGGGGPGLTGAEEILLRAAVAALLNTTNAHVAYPLTVGEITLLVDQALQSGNRETILSVASTLDAYNNGPGGCPLN